MENDYLWDKTGEDREIERLEGALKQFRYQPTAPPVLPVKILPVDEKPRFSFFNLRFAMAGLPCLAIVFAGLGIWSQLSIGEMVEVADLSKPIVAPIEIPNDSVKIGTRRGSDLANHRTRSPLATTRGSDFVRGVETKPKFVAVSQPTQIVYRQPAPKVKQSKKVKLTPEEQYAYDQLMLALSITGEKLKEVKDKANGVEESLASKSLK